MADNDAFLKSIGTSWKKGYEAACGFGSPYQVGELAVSGVCKVIASCGYAGFTDFQIVLEPFCMANGQAILRAQDHEEAIKQCDIIAGSYAGDEMKSAIAQAEARVVQGLLLQAKMTGLLHGDAGQLIASKLLPEVIDALFLGRLNYSRKINNRFVLSDGGNAADALFDFQDKVRSLLPNLVDSAARRLADDPTGQTLPKRRIALPKMTTPELVYRSIG